MNFIDVRVNQALRELGLTVLVSVFFFIKH